MPYVGGDPVNRTDPKGLFWEMVSYQMIPTSFNLDLFDGAVTAAMNQHGLPWFSAIPPISFFLFEEAERRQIHRNELSDRAKKSIRKFLSPGSPCAEYFEKQFGSGGGSVQALIKRSDDIQWIDVGFELSFAMASNTTIGDLVYGAQLSGLLLVDWFKSHSNGYAEVLRDRDGNIMPAVLMYSELNAGGMVHEALHVYTGRSDLDLARALNLNEDFGSGSMAQGIASVAIKSFLDAGCPQSMVRH